MGLNLLENLILEADDKGNKYSTPDFTMGLRTKEIGRCNINPKNVSCKLGISKKTLICVYNHKGLKYPTRSYCNGILLKKQIFCIEFH